MTTPSDQPLTSATETGTAPAAPGPDLWYYSRDGKQDGPVSFAQLQEMRLTGEVLPGDYLWQPGMTDWLPATQMLEFPAVLPHAPAAARPEQPTWPYAAPTSVMHAGGLPVAAFWHRIAAFLIDMAVMIAVLIVVGIPLNIIFKITPEDGENVRVAMSQPTVELVESSFAALSPSVRHWFFWGMGTTLLIPPMYGALFLISPWRATPGKRLMKLRVARLNGDRIGIGRAVLRELFKWIYLIVLTLMLTSVSAMMSPPLLLLPASALVVYSCFRNRQRLYERALDMVVVRRDNKTASRPRGS